MDEGNRNLLTAGAAGDERFTDEELTELALAAAPDAPLDPDAVPLSVAHGRVAGLLPSWYMPAASWSFPDARPARRRWHLAAALSIVAALVTLEALGLCSVFGQVVVG